MGDDYYRLTPVKVRQILHYGTFIVGTHDVLIDRKGAYYNLVKNQLELGN